MQEVNLTTLCGVCGNPIIRDRRYKFTGCSKKGCPQYEFSVEAGSRELEEISIVCPICFSATMRLSLLGTRKYLCLNPACSCYTVSTQKNRIDISYLGLLLFSLCPNKNNILEVVYCYISASVSGEAKQRYKKLIQEILRMSHHKTSIKLTALEQPRQYKRSFMKNRTEK